MLLSVFRLHADCRDSGGTCVCHRTGDISRPSHTASSQWSAKFKIITPNVCVKCKTGNVGPWAVDNKSGLNMMCHKIFQYRFTGKF